MSSNISGLYHFTIALLFEIEGEGASLYVPTQIVRSLSVATPQAIFTSGPPDAFAERVGVASAVAPGVGVSTGREVALGGLGRGAGVLVGNIGAGVVVGGSTVPTGDGG